MRLYNHLQPQVVNELSRAISLIHISFDGWTTKGGKRGFFGVVAHYANASGEVVDLPIALPQLSGSHTGERIGELVVKTLHKFGITARKLGYFVLDNASANDKAVKYIASKYDFEAAHRRLRCAPHIINLVGQALLFGKDRDSYDNDSKNVAVS